VPKVINYSPETFFSAEAFPPGKKMKKKTRSMQQKQEMIVLVIKQ